mgnify:CR=1 FL=1
MLTKGDLVIIKQDSFLYPSNLEPWHVRRVKEPEFGVVIAQANDEECRVFVLNQTWIVANKSLKLIGDKDVCKIKPN